MSRIPVSASVALAGLLPVCAAALGLGEIQSRSFLNQPLAAEIPVLSEAPGELAGIAVTLASPETFSQYGLQRPAFLGDLAFAVRSGAGGPVILITSAQPVMEPFVTMLLEVRWPQGRLLREYTVLLDPPSFTGGSVRQPVQAPATSAPPQRGEAAPVATPAAAEPPPSGGEGTHVVARRETLWGIADRYRPDPSADINQVMLAIYRANPDAFAGNINRLNAGAVLRIPKSADIQGMSRGAAGEEVRRQNREWQGAGAGAIERPARLELVPPPEATTAPATTAGVATASRPAPPPSDIEESKRLLAVKDAELQALRQRVTELERAGSRQVPPAEAAVEAEPVAAAPIEAEPLPAEPATPESTQRPAPPPAVEAARTPSKPAAVKKSVPAPGGGILGTIGDLLSSIWLWIAAAAVLVGALLLARRRSAAEETPAWRPPTRPSGRDDAEAAPAGRGERADMIVIEEPGRAQATGGFERRGAPRGDEELPLERTISTDGPVNLDQSDPLAEADFHMAYGLYDQAADLLVAAINREPARRDLLLKLVDVYFVWENRDGFLKQARSLRQQVGSDSDPDWRRVVIMGKQLCPNEPMFAGAALPEADEMDLSLSSDSGGSVDFALDGADGGLDFDLSGDTGLELDSNAPTKVARQWSASQTQEIATLEAPGIDSGSTMETPTIESPALSSTMETPTIETARPGRTMETPTIEAPPPAFGGTARLQGLGGGDERQDQTAEIDLEDLGLDLTGLDDAARDMATGVQEALPDAEGGLDFDLSAGLTTGAGDGDESTAEMENKSTLKNRASPMGRDAAGAGLVDDTAEQLALGGAGDSMMTPALSATSDELESLNIDLEIGGAQAGSESDLTATGLRAIGGRRPEDPTMTEVGTKLDLARAYVDMGDPDGARSILNEVLEEGDPAQRQEARQLLDSLDK